MTKLPVTEMERVGLWNTVAGKPCGSAIDDQELLINQVKYIIEEVNGDNELYASYIRRHEHGLLDGCGDALVTAVGVFHLLGHDSFARLPATTNREVPLTVEDLPDIIHELRLYISAIEEDPLRISAISTATFVIECVCDILHIRGYDPEAVLKIINDSNFTKFCKTLNEAKASVAAYSNKDRYVNVKYKYMKGSGYRVIQGDDKAAGVVGKTLKSIYFTEPCFIDMIREINPDKLVGG